MKKYCTQNNWDCETCSLVNYGHDCHNNQIAKMGDCDTCHAAADMCHCGDYINTAPLSAAQKARIAEETRKATKEEIDNFFCNPKEETNHD